MSLAVCWNLTNVCNKDCDYCFRELNEEAQLLETNIGILNNLSMMDVSRITFSGGEPFLYPNLLELIKLAHEKGITCDVVTNGSMLNADNIEEYLKYVDRLTFSCDSPRGYINELIGRGEDSYDHIKEILPIIRKTYDKDKLKININSVVTYDPSGSYEELDYMLKAIRSDFKKYDLDKWKILRFYPLRCNALENRDLFWIPDEHFIEIKQKYQLESSLLNIDVRDIKEFDENYIVSPCGFLKKSANGQELVLCDLKPFGGKSKGSEIHV